MTWTFAPTTAALRGGRAHHELRARPEVAGVEILAPLVANAADAAWVRARIPRVFGYTPAPSEVEKSLICEPFAATCGDTTHVIHCMDHYGKTGLFFDPSLDDAAIKAAIADAFWALLLAAPTAVAEFRTRVFHDGAGYWLEYFSEAGVVDCNHLVDDGDDGDDADDA